MGAAETIRLKTVEKGGGLSTRKHRDWFGENDAEIQKLLQAKCSCHTKLLPRLDDHATTTAYEVACINVQSRLREIQNKWWLDLAEKTQLYANIGNSKSFYEGLRAVYGPTYQVQATLRSSDGSALLTDRVSILHHWTEHKPVSSETDTQSRSLPLRSLSRMSS